jgi:hypothetical protein
MDDSNLFISAQNIARGREGQAAKLQVRLQFDNIIKLAIAGRTLGSICVVGSIPPEEREIWERLEQATGVKPELYERGSVSGKEQGVDQCLQVHMLRASLDNPEPQIAVMMTGDGAGYDEGIGFHADLERMHESGWGIEVISWENSCKKALRDWAIKNGAFIGLENFYNSVTFLEGGRRALPLSLSTRPIANTGKSPVMLAEERIRAEYDAKMAEAKRQMEAMEYKATRKAKYERRFARGAKKV